MSHSVIVSKGKDVHEAITIGLEVLEARRQEVEIEIIENATKGFLGIFGSKPAIVRLVKKSLEDKTAMDQLRSQDQEVSPSKPQDTLPEMTEIGKAWITDGRIFCKETPTHYPTITPKKGITLYKNGEIVKQPTVISEKDQFKVDLNDELKETTWSIELDDRKMIATLHIQPGYKRTRTLVDQEPSPHIKLEFAEEEEIINHLQIASVVQRMQELGIQTGIREIEVFKACEARVSGVFEIARGIEPEQGQDGWLELKVNTELLKNEPKELENGRVDFREIQTIPSVDAGQVIVIVHPPAAGKPGMTVTGEMIPPPLPKELNVQARKGADLIEDGTKIVAVDSGRPHIEYQGNVARVSVVPRLYHAAHVDLASGNLHFSGDIEVQGNAEEGMTVEALGDVLIHGLSNRAIITAGNRIVIRGSVINSSLAAGKSNLLLEDMGQLLGKIADQLEGLALAIQELYLSAAFKTSDFARMGLSSLIRILLERKFSEVPKLVKELSDLTAKADKEQRLDQGFKEVVIKLSNGFLKFLPTQFRVQKDLSALIQQVKALDEWSRTPSESDASIIIPYALNSEIYCSGDVYVIDQGCIHSKIHSGGRLQVSGMVRGGQVYAALGADIGEAGTPGGRPTRIHVPFGQTIRIKYVMEGTYLQIGNQTHQFLTADNDVFARIDREGNWLFH
ncbi:flagellar assembly protein A [Ammoniphilus sp. 3BR4]|uniref:flagellar assembly protein A n=1 Tax=Ammoniphilus sp. 3BR4 TaxID=3158265 RepID=UPI003465190A